MLMIIVSIISAFPRIARAQTPIFITLKFGEIASIDVPRTWTPLNENLREQLKTTGSALLEISGMPGIENEYCNLVAANAYTVDDFPSATMRLAYDPGVTMTQADVLMLTSSELNDVASIMAAQLERSFELNNDPQRIVALGGVLKKCGDYSAVVITYTRTTTSQVEYTVELTMIFLGSHSVKMTLSCRTTEELFFRSQLRRIRESLVVGK
jgi:hypothetical protein